MLKGTHSGAFGEMVPLSSSAPACLTASVSLSVNEGHSSGQTGVFFQLWKSVVHVLQTWETF
jgi:hypothetical protein